jgi:hypothetical protein
MTDINFSTYKSTLLKQGELYIARDLNPNGTKDYACCSFKELRPYLDYDNCLYELLKEDNPRKIYFDFDCKFDSVRSWCEGNDETDNKDEIISIVLGMFETYLDEYGWGELPEYTILDASNTLKYSFHFCFNLALKNHLESLIFHKKFIQFCKINYETN